MSNVIEIEAADTIERQAKEIKDLTAENKTRKDIGYERDAALAAIQDLHQKTYDDLAAAKAEVERLKGEKGPLLACIKCGHSFSSYASAPLDPCSRCGGEMVRS